MFAVYSRPETEKAWKLVGSFNTKDEAVKAAEEKYAAEGQAMIRVPEGKPKPELPAEDVGGLVYPSSLKQAEKSLEAVLEESAQSAAVVKKIKVRGGKKDHADMNPLEHILAHFGGGDDGDEASVVATVPMRPEWKKVLMDGKRKYEESKAATLEAKHLRRKFWYMVETDLHEYRQMKLAEDFSEIYVMGDAESDEER